MRNDNEALEPLRRRFGMRLDAALDGLGYPVLKAARTRSLATALGVDTAVAAAFISGLELPDYEQLLALCALLRQQPGYFLDAHVLDLPPGTRLVKPMGIGEDLVLRLPSEVLSDAQAAKGLQYWRATVPMGFGIGAGEYLVALAGAEEAGAQPHQLYLLYSEQTVEVVQCADVHSDRAVFHTDAVNDVPRIVPTGSHTKKLRDLSRLVASIRCGDSLHVRL